MERLRTGGDMVDLAEAYAYPENGTWLRANMVGTIDGMAQWDGRVGRLTNETDQRLFHLLRGLSDVVITGAETVRAERYGPVRPKAGWDRLREGRAPVPPLAIVSRSLALDFTAPVFAKAAVPTIVLTCEAADPGRRRHAQAHAEVIVAGGDRVDFELAVAELTARGHHRLLCEGGPHVLSQLAAAGVLDELCLAVSPVLLGGGGLRLTSELPIPRPERFRLAGVLTDEDYLFLRYLRP
ncbi:pyrimidine reductase family protein [Actinomadura scrupuli]|uniref:pyrimidine reductase family protein n=1 Tax=Actinomadura scrupuli TaxID=559629 RepID=UPI003D987935